MTGDYEDRETRVQRARERQDGQPVAAVARPISAYPAPLRYVMELIHRYVVMTPEQLLVTALWVLHTHCIDAADQSPYLAVTSPRPRCGKSRLMEILQLVVVKPWMAVMPTEAVLYRKVSKETPTLLLDEVDAIFSVRNGEKYEPLRAVVNVGNRQGATVPRCVGPAHEVKEFNVFCPKVLAGIGTLPSTVADRSIPIRLERKTREDDVRRFASREVKPKGKAVHTHVRKWARENVDDLKDARPVMPDELDDRAQEGGETLVAIADALGCGEEARQALVALYDGSRADDQQSVSERLLADIRTVFTHDGDPKTISNADLVGALCRMEEGEWNHWYGRAIEPRDISKLLRDYGVKSKPVHIAGTKGTERGYERDDFYDAWQRYLPPPEDEPADTPDDEPAPVDDDDDICLEDF
jgi:hypothetical protein